MVEQGNQAFSGLLPSPYQDVVSLGDELVFGPLVLSAEERVLLEPGAHGVGRAVHVVRDLVVGVPCQPELDRSEMDRAERA
jgi:hypothetical protein